MKSLLLFVLLLKISGGFSAKVLFITAMCTGSEENFYKPIIQELALRGHEVTSVTSKKAKLPDYITQLEPVSYKEIYAGVENPFAMQERNEDMSFLFLDVDYYVELCKRVFANKEFQEKVLNKKFDIILLSTLVHQCFYGLAPKNNASLISLVSFPMPNYILHGLGTYFPPSLFPFPTLPLPDNMNFFERIYNFLADTTLLFLQELVYLDKFENVYREYLPGGDKLPGIREIHRNISLTIMNTFHVYHSPRPLLPDVIETGGLHCKPGKPLSPDLEKFVSPAEAPEGFIYFSLGSMIKGSMLPNKTRDVFIKVFSKLKQRVLWKWETDGEMHGCPPNVKISNWFSQQDILAHSNIRFFISHGGIFSTQESIYNGVPIIGAPVFFDQFANIKHAVKQGYALEIDIYDLKEKQLQWAITQMLYNITYKERASSMSAVFRDQEQNPLDRAIYWIEYVIRHNGAPHLRSGARDLYWFQFHSLDVLLFLAATISIVVFIFIKVLRMIFNCLCSSTKVDKEKKSK